MLDFPSNLNLNNNKFILEETKSHNLTGPLVLSCLFVVYPDKTSIVRPLGAVVIVEKRSKRADF